MVKFDFTKLKEAIEINSYTENSDGVNQNGKLFQEEMEKLGFRSKIFKRGGIGNHFYFRSPDLGEDKVLLLGHLDTVFPEGTFESFSEDDLWIYGAGVCDMKGGNYLALQVLKNIKEKFGEIRGIDMLLVSDEETGSDDSKFLTEQLASYYRYSFVFEASGKNGELVVARKGVGTFFVDIKGLSSHSGNHYSDGADANLEASYKTIELTKLTDLENGTTLNVGKIEGGVGANTISPSAKLTFEIRYTKESERERLLKEINRIISTNFIKGTRSRLSGGIQRDVMESSDEKEGLIKLFEDITGKTVPTESRGGVSDANVTSSAGVLTLDGFGPFGDGDHTLKERASKRSFNQRVEFTTKILSYFQEQGHFL